MKMKIDDYYVKVNFSSLQGRIGDFKNSRVYVESIQFRKEECAGTTVAVITFNDEGSFNIRTFDPNLTVASVADMVDIVTATLAGCRIASIRQPEP